MFAVLAISYGIVFGFTTVFVVPLMTADNGGVLSRWSRLPILYATPIQLGTAPLILSHMDRSEYAILAVIAAATVGLGVFALILPFRGRRNRRSRRYRPARRTVFIDPQ
ncbi:hypothetical protein C9J85_11770 [Haloferax sp. wsp5]|nr:hypothetical protein C9J85_11770 [Haloferax sp. wsp5]